MVKVNIIQKPETEEIPAEIIAQSIVEIAKAMKKMDETRLTRKAIVTLISKQSGIGAGDINVILNNLESLEEIWLKPLKK